MLTTLSRVPGWRASAPPQRVTPPVRVASAAGPQARKGPGSTFDGCISAADGASAL